MPSWPSSLGAAFSKTSGQHSTNLIPFVPTQSSPDASHETLVDHNDRKALLGAAVPPSGAIWPTENLMNEAQNFTYIPTKDKVRQTLPDEQRSLKGQFHPSLRTGPTLRHPQWTGPPTLAKRLGKHHIYVNIVSIIVLAIAVALLLFLWFSPGDNPTWRHIMIGGWVGQLVTLTTLAIRLSTVVQAGTAVSMLAAVWLEQNGALLHNTAALTIARYVNSGPVTSLLPFWQDLPRRHERLGRHMVAMTTMSALAITSVAIQFTSTLLLWDVRQGLVAGFSEHSPLTVGFNVSHFQNTTTSGNDLDPFQIALTATPQYWSTSPQMFPVFAEFHKPTKWQSDRLVDTGPTIRALLPSAQEIHRSTLARYDGVASLLDARVTCLKPNITQMNFTSLEDFDVNQTDVRVQYLSGVLSPTFLKDDKDEDDLTKMLLMPDYDIDFSCTRSVSSSAERNFYLCALPPSSGGLIPSLDYMNNGSLQHMIKDSVSGYWQAGSNMKSWEDDGWDVEIGHAYLLFDFTESESRAGGYWPTSNSSSKRTEDLWHRSSINRQKNKDFGVTVCYDALYSNLFDESQSLRYAHVQEFNISATRKVNHTEPALSRNAAGTGFDTLDIMEQLGSSPNHLNSMDRGVLDLNISGVFDAVKQYQAIWDPAYFSNISDGENLDGANFVNQTTYDFLNSVPWRMFGLSTVSVVIPCRGCYAKPYDPEAYTNPTPVVSKVLSAIFTDVMSSTQNPALAPQSLLTSLTRMVYYDFLPIFDYKSTASVTYFKSCQKPQRYTGFAIVMAALLTHLFLIAIITRMFLMSPGYATLDNAWQSIAQMWMPETKRLFEEADEMSDKDVQQWIDRDWQSPRRRYRIRMSPDGDRVGLA